jgi:hypothetical protein
MHKDFILSISRKYLGLMLVIASLLFIASTNASSSVVTSPTSRSGSVVTFLSPKRVPTNTSTAATSTEANTDVDYTMPSSTSGSVGTSSTSAPANGSTTTPAVLPTPASAPDIVPPAPTETYVPPANDAPEPYTPPASRCGSCRPPTYNNSGPQMMCPQYMACMY